MKPTYDKCIIAVLYCSLLQFLVQTHEFEGSCSDLLVHDKHEGSRQHRLQQLGLQAFVQTKKTIPPVMRRFEKKKLFIFITI